MKITAIFLMLSCAALHAAPATSSTTAPTSAPFANEPIGHGVVRFAPPDGWDMTNRSDDDRLVNYKSADESGVISIAITPEQTAITDAPKAHMAQTIIKAITEHFKKDGTEILSGPKVERDDRFYLRVHDVSKKEGKVADRIQIYRAVGLNLVLVSAIAFSEDEKVVKETFGVGEKMLESARAARTPKPMIFGKTHVQITAPLDWKEKKSDIPNGLTATYLDPSDENQMIIVKSRILPRDAKNNVTKRDALITQMIDADRTGEPPVKGATRTGEPDAPTDAKAIKTVRATYKSDSVDLQADSRYIVVGDEILSITSVARPGNADSQKKTTDLLVDTIKAVGK